MAVCQMTLLNMWLHTGGGCNLQSTNCMPRFKNRMYDPEINQIRQEIIEKKEEIVFLGMFIIVSFNGFGSGEAKVIWIQYSGLVMNKRWLSTLTAWASFGAFGAHGALQEIFNVTKTCKINFNTNLSI